MQISLPNQCLHKGCGEPINLMPEHCSSCMRLVHKSCQQFLLIWALLAAHCFVYFEPMTGKTNVRNKKSKITIIPGSSNAPYLVSNPKKSIPSLPLGGFLTSSLVGLIAGAVVLPRIIGSRVGLQFRKDVGPSSAGDDTGHPPTLGWAIHGRRPPSTIVFDLLPFSFVNVDILLLLPLPWGLRMTTTRAGIVVKPLFPYEGGRQDGQGFPCTWMGCQLSLREASPPPHLSLPSCRATKNFPSSCNVHGWLPPYCIPAIFSVIIVIILVVVIIMTTIVPIVVCLKVSISSVLNALGSYPRFSI
jgi:hypothetical protein